MHNGELKMNTVDKYLTEEVKLDKLMKDVLTNNNNLISAMMKTKTTNKLLSKYMIQVNDILVDMLQK